MGRSNLSVAAEPQIHRRCAAPQDQFENLIATAGPFPTLSQPRLPRNVAVLPSPNCGWHASLLMLPGICDFVHIITGSPRKIYRRRFC